MTGKTEERRREILASILPHVVFDGWTLHAMKAGAEDMKLEDGELFRHFPRGAADVIAFFSREADKAMLEELAKLDLPSMRVRDKVAAAVQLRLSAVEAEKEAVRRGVAFFALPVNAPLGLTCLYRTVDAIWQGIGDRSTDYNFYTKRLLLSGVYSSTLIHWLDDKSEGHDASWQFLDRRIDEVLKIGGRLGKGIGQLLNLPDRIIAKRGRGPFRNRPVH
ncbi:MAG: COQ9 family protein [Kiloniellales bacterium]|nr:COQ9 family protein [Kiloniellales bacterium]